MELIFFSLAVLVVLCAAEYGRHKGWLYGEFGRKFVHITVGSMVALAPYILSWSQIRVLSVAFVLGVIISVKLNIFRAIHVDARPTWGEVFFALAVGGVTLVTEEPAIYAVALLHMAVADGLAALMGTAYGKRSMYRVFGHRKSVIGTATFALASAALMATYVLYGNSTPYMVLASLVVVTTILENVSVRGADNFVVPMVIALTLAHV